MKKKRHVTLTVVLTAAALIGLAGWAYARPAVASPGHAGSEAGSFRAHRVLDHGLHRLKGEDGRSRLEGREEESGDREDSTATTGRVTTTTAPGATTTTTQSTTTTTQPAATTTTTQATTTTTQPPSTTTTQPPSTTTTVAIDSAALFSTNCRSCHGPNGTPIGSSLTAAQILAKITTGSMSGYASSLSSAQKSALATYVAGGGR